MSRGVIYIAFGDRYVSEALYSAASLKAVSDVPVTLFTDKAVAAPQIDDVRIFEPRHKRAKIDMLAESPFERTLYLDSDTRILEDVSPLLALLDRVDIAAAQDQCRRSHRWAAAIDAYAAIPETFSELNCGILAYRKSDATLRLFARWNEIFARYRDLTNGQDQAAFRIALWQTDVAFSVLAPEWNRRNQALVHKIDRRVRKAGVPHPLRDRILHWHGVDRDRPWYRLSPRHRPASR